MQQPRVPFIKAVLFSPVDEWMRGHELVQEPWITVLFLKQALGKF